MASIGDKRSALRKEIADLIEKLNGQKHLLSRDDANDLSAFASTLHELLKKTAALEHLADLHEEKIIVEVPVIQTVVQPETPVVPMVPVPEVKTPPPVVPQPKPEIPTAPVSKILPDLKSMIGFNEKLMFVKNLFGNDNSVYDAAIQQLNSCTSFDEASSFVSVVSGEYQWKMNSDAAVAFLSVVKRKFA